MFNKHSTFIVLALVILVASALACNPPTPSPAHSTVTPYVPATAQSQDAPSGESTAVPEATEAPPPTPEDEPTATDTPQPTDTPPPPTKVPPTAAPPATVGTLDFEPPQFIHAWEPKGSTNKVVLKVEIVGGVPPFTVSHGPTVQGTTSDRVFFIEFEWYSCKSAMVQSITVSSSDGQTIKKDYFIPVERMPWCTTPSP